MASLSISSLPTSITTPNKPFLISESSLTHSNRIRFQCKAAASADNNENSNILPKSSFERRNLLLGLGGLYGAANIPSAFGIPIEAPDSASSCYEAFSSVVNPTNAIRGLACCPPFPLDANDVPKDYMFPPVEEVRVRKPAHLAKEEYIQKFNKAIGMMKALPDSDPHSWKNQAKIHCAYCNGGYRQDKSGFPDLEIQVHNSWLFLPFHRWYLYFLEKIMGKILNDESFALPYWNWDNINGMTLPAMYEGNPRNQQNFIFDPFREPKHVKDAIFDFNYGNSDLNVSRQEQIDINLALMYRQMISSGYNTRTFMGGELKAGMNPRDNSLRGVSLGGSLENGVHTGAHRWVGNSRMPNGEDMGNFYSAGFDPVFYGHHANVDRMWTVWKELGVQLGRLGHTDPTHEDWLGASYVFYDENRVRVRVYNKDSVDTVKMGYKYEPSETPWVKKRPIGRARVENVASKAADDHYVKNVTVPGVLPLTLGEKEPVRVLVSRPVGAKNRSDKDKKDRNEMLFLDDINYDCEKFIRFNVLVNVPVGTEKTVNAAKAEFVGSFAQLPHNHGDKNMVMKTSEAFGITDLLEDTKAEGDDFILVTIVPVVECKGVTIPSISIEMVDAVPETQIPKPESGEFKF